MSKAAMTLLQTALRDLGYDPGGIDGVFGPKTNLAAQSLLLAGGAAASAVLTPTTSATIYQGAARHPVDEAVIHCAATRPDWMAGGDLTAQRAEIRRWHLNNGWADIGYHHLIGRNGDVIAGRPETTVGAGVAGHNNGVIHICLIGGHGSSERDRFRENFTLDQDIALRALLRDISARTRIRRISGHNEWAAKACPGFTVSTWLKEGY